MSAIDVAAVYDVCRTGLKDLLGADTDAHVVEATIDAYPLDDEHKAALWLWAIAPFDHAALGVTDKPSSHDRPR